MSLTNSMNPTTASDALPPRAVITVGSPKADLPGTTGRSIQIAIDAVAAAGGGEVRLAPKDYLLTDSLRLRPRVAIIGEPGATRLHRGPLVWSRLASDADKSETLMRPVDPESWKVGMGVCFYNPANQHWSQANLPLSILSKDGDACHLDDHLIVDTIAESGGLAVNHFPMIVCKDADDASMQGIEIDAAVDDPDAILSGLFCNAVYVYRSQRVHLSKLVVKNAQCDGIVISNNSADAVIENCEVLDSANFGIHPGSHSTAPLVQGCTIRGSGSDGIWVCWGVRGGRFIDNTITDNGWKLNRSGICIGHKDTDVLFQGNHISGNCKHGIAFRAETHANGAHRTVIRNNQIENNGSQPTELAELKASLPASESIGCGIHIDPFHCDIVIEQNTIRETRTGATARQRHAVYIAKGSSTKSLSDNILSTHPEQPVIDENSATA